MQNTVNIKRWLNKDYSNNNIPIPTNEKYQRELKTKVYSRDIIVTRLYKIQIGNSAK